MYAWDETQASKGSQEMMSCLFRHFQTLKSEKYTVICGG